MSTIFNDLLFESPEAQYYFQQMTADMPPEEVDKLRSVLGKPSQFVGRVMSFDQAVEHWKAWEEWHAQEELKKSVVEKAKSLSLPSVELELARQLWHRTVELAREDAAAWHNWQRDAIAQIRQQHRDAEIRRAAAVEQAREHYKRLKNE
jgi:hypothetical protein